MPKDLIVDIKKAYKALWVIVSSVIILLSAFVLFSNDAQIYGVSSMMQIHHDGVCSFCGMTRSFVSIMKGSSHGNIINEAAFPLFSLLVVNQILFFSYIGSKIFKIKKVQ